VTDLIERVDVGPAEAPAKTTPAETGAPDPTARHTEQFEPMAPNIARIEPGPILLAVALGCSAILLFMTAAPRFTSWRMGAIAFVVAAWLQVALAVGVVRTQRRAICLWVVGTSVAIAALWAAALAGHHVMNDFSAGVGIALSVSAMLATVVLVVKPRFGTGWQSSTLALGSILPVAIVVVTTTALALPATSATYASGPRSNTATTGATSSNPFFNSVKVPGQSSSRFLQIASGNDSEKSERDPWVPLSPSDQALLSKQLFEAEEAAFRYPTVADAKKAGLILAGGMAPGVGAHYQSLSPAAINGVYPDGTINPADPGAWIYASTADNAPVVGVMYEAFTKNPPSGFAGPNDHWHQHSNLCITYAGGKIGVPFAPDTSVTPQQCATVHGQFLKKTMWMVHAWVVPGWESPLGPFSHSNPHLYCPGNTDLTDAIGFCLRQQ
jgi:hypothetical protein